MEIKARQRDNVVILDICGRLDVNSAHFVEAVGQCLRDGYTDILCNFEDVEFIDYMGISVVVIAYKEVLNNHGRMKFVNIPAHLRGTLSVSGIDRAVEIYAEEETAIKSFREDKIIEKISSMQLRRRFRRLPLDIKAELSGKVDKGCPSCHQADILNLSAIGAFVFGCDKFRLGDEVAIKFKLPPKNEEMRLPAKVVWIADRQVQPHNYPGIGVEFREITFVEQQRLLEFIERNLSFSSTDQP